MRQPMGSGRSGEFGDNEARNIRRCTASRSLIGSMPPMELCANERPQQRSSKGRSYCDDCNATGRISAAAIVAQCCREANSSGETSYEAYARPYQRPGPARVSQYLNTADVNEA